ncbi:MAG: hypothetical protein M1831_004233 [Alyxoria varia]|nr:MAG: hypothetical protein M1831_004233 [Alyxoria varia]
MNVRKFNFDPVIQIDETSYYTILEVPKDADVATIQDAFRALRFKYHPDVIGRNHGGLKGLEEYSKEEGIDPHEPFRLINLAHSVLENPISRRKYDAEIPSDNTAPSSSREAAENPAKRKTHGKTWRNTAFVQFYRRSLAHRHREESARELQQHQELLSDAEKELLELKSLRSKHHKAKVKDLSQKIDRYRVELRTKVDEDRWAKERLDMINGGG